MLSSPLLQSVAVRIFQPRKVDANQRVFIITLTISRRRARHLHLCRCHQTPSSQLTPTRFYKYSTAPPATQLSQEQDKLLLSILVLLLGTATAVYGGKHVNLSKISSSNVKDLSIILPTLITSCLSDNTAQLNKSGHSVPHQIYCKELENYPSAICRKCFKSRYCCRPVIGQAFFTSSIIFVIWRHRS